MSASETPRIRESSIERIPFGGCWIWLGSLARNGYGKTGPYLAHRISFSMKHGPIPDGMQLDHLCRNRSCVNPAHLEVVTQKENILRGLGWGGVNVRKTHCDNGHEFTDENTIIRAQGWRGCRACDIERKRSERRVAK